MLRKIKKLENSLLNLLLFLFPTQLAIHFWPKEAFVFGIRVDYLSPAIYLTDILAIILICLWFYLRRNEFLKTVKKYKKVIYVFIILATANILFSTFPILSFFRWHKYLEFLLLAFYLSHKNYSIKPLFYSAVLFSLIGIFQFSTGGTLGGLIYFLGERTFNVGTPGIALITIKGREFLRAYSTFAHPNSMAGYFGVLLTYLFLSKRLKELNYKTLGFGIIILGFVLTFSTSAFIAGVLSIIFYKFLRENPKVNLSKLSISVFVTFSAFQIFFGNIVSTGRPVGYQNITERLNLARVSGRMIIESPLVGVGLNTFIPNLISHRLNGGSIWLLQPVHNLFLLVFSETGLIGVTIFVTLIYYGFRFSFKKKNLMLCTILLFLILTGLTDHYWLTLQQNNLLLVFIISHFI